MLEYLIAFVTVIVLNVVPFLMPPTWLVLGFFYNTFPFDALALATIGAVCSTSGRVLLSHFSSYFRRFMHKERRKDMDLVGKKAKQHSGKSFLVTFLFSLSPFPSNVYFIGVGLARARHWPIFAGFFAGRLISYYLLIRAAQIIFSSIEEIFASRLAQVLVIDVAGIIFMLLFLMVDWSLLMEKRRLRIVPLELPFRKKKTGKRKHKIKH